MCHICDAWDAKKIDTKEAFRRIKEDMKFPDQKEQRHLIELSDRIMDQEIPFEETDPDSESYTEE